MKLSSLALCLVAVLALYSCEDTPYPIEDPVIRLQTDLTQRVLTPVGHSGDTTRVDSMLVSSVKILVRQVRLHRELTSLETGYEMFAATPIVLTVPGGVVYGSSFPLGNYDGAALELTRLTESEVAQYASDARYADFVTPERLSFVMEGTVLVREAWSPFRFTADTVAPSFMLFDSPIGVPKGSATDLVLLLDLPELMLFGKEVINPLGRGNDRLLEERLLPSLKIMKRDR